MIWYFSPSLRAINLSGTQWKKSSYKEILHLKKASGFPEINNLSTVENKGERKRTDLICVLSFLVLSGFTVPLLFLLILFSSSSTSWNLAVSFDTRGAYLAKRSHLFFFWRWIPSGWKLLVCVSWEEGSACVLRKRRMVTWRDVMHFLAPFKENTFQNFIFKILFIYIDIYLFGCIRL